METRGHLPPPLLVVCDSPPGCSIFPESVVATGLEDDPPTLDPRRLRCSLLSTSIPLTSPWVVPRVDATCGLL